MKKLINVDVKAWFRKFVHLEFVWSLVFGISRVFSRFVWNTWNLVLGIYRKIFSRKTSHARIYIGHQKQINKVLINTDRRIFLLILALFTIILTAYLVFTKINRVEAGWWPLARTSLHSQRLGENDVYKYLLQYV